MFLRLYRYSGFDEYKYMFYENDAKLFKSILKIKMLNVKLLFKR